MDALGNTEGPSSLAGYLRAAADVMEQFSVSAERQALQAELERVTGNAPGTAAPAARSGLNQRTLLLLVLGAAVLYMVAR